MAGLCGIGGGVAYISAKHALVGITRHIAVNYAKYGIHANAICPASIRTRMTEKALEDKDVYNYIVMRSGRIGTVQDVAGTAMFLLSDASSYVNGETIRLDGGALMC